MIFRTQFEWQLQTVLLDTSSLIETGFYNSISSDSLASSCCYDFCISILNCEHNLMEWETSQALLQAGGWIFPFELLPYEQLQVNWLLEETNVGLRQLLIQKIGFPRIYQELQIGDNMNLLAQTLQEEPGSIWVVYTLLQNREDAYIKQIIDNWISGARSGAQFDEKNIAKLRKAVLVNYLERILNWLQQNAPSYASGFLPSLSYEEIEEKLRNLPYKTSREVYDLYQWRNGTDSEAMIFVYHYFWDLNLKYNPGTVDSRLYLGGL